MMKPSAASPIVIVAVLLPGVVEGSSGNLDAIVLGAVAVILGAPAFILGLLRAKGKVSHAASVVILMCLCLPMAGNTLTFLAVAAFAALFYFGGLRTVAFYKQYYAKVDAKQARDVMDHG